MQKGRVVKEKNNKVWKINRSWERDKKNGGTEWEFEGKCHGMLEGSNGVLWRQMTGNRRGS